jgi:SAM-dependent methyltransferase
MIDIHYVDALRAEEITRVVRRHRDLFAGKDLLEIGSGTGAQLQVLATVCRSTVGIETADSGYTAHRRTQILEYDGHRIPFPDASFDLVFSSNVMEHIVDQEAIHKETHRVLRRDGAALHIVPTATWRLWTSLVHYPALPRNLLSRLRHPKAPASDDGSMDHAQHRRWQARLLNALISPRHGEFGNRLSEFLLLRTAAWRKRFESHAWRVEAAEPLGLAYSGYCLFAGRLSLRTRTWLARAIGSSGILFVLRPR